MAARTAPGDRFFALLSAAIAGPPKGTVAVLLAALPLFAFWIEDVWNRTHSLAGARHFCEAEGKRVTIDGLAQSFAC